MGAHFRCNLIDDVRWEMMGNYLPDNCQVFLADNKSRRSTGMRMDQILVDIGSEESNDVDKNSAETDGQRRSQEGRIKRIRLMTAYDADFTAGESAIVIGGETHGLSRNAYGLSTKFHGCTIYLPMMPGIESINAAMATTAILFEAKRQILCKDHHSDGERDGVEQDEAVAESLK